jgi:hypothetical protein
MPLPAVFTKLLAVRAVFEEMNPDRTKPVGKFIFAALSSFLLDIRYP